MAIQGMACMTTFSRLSLNLAPDETDVCKSPELPQEVGLLVMDIFLLAAIWHITGFE